MVPKTERWVGVTLAEYRGGSKGGQGIGRTVRALLVRESGKRVNVVD